MVLLTFTPRLLAIHIVGLYLINLFNIAVMAPLSSKVGCPNILKAEGHDNIAERSLRGDECRLFPILLYHLDLIVV